MAAVAWMAQVPPRGYRTWACACGRHTLALAVEECPGCGSPQPGTAPPAPSSPAPEPPAAPAPRPQPRRTRTRAPKGG